MCPPNRRHIKAEEEDAEETVEEDDGYEWDYTEAIIPKPLLLASNRAQA